MYGSIRGSITKFMTGIAVLTLAGATAFAQDAQEEAVAEILAATEVTFFDDLPSRGGSTLAEGTVAAIPLNEAIEQAEYVQLTYGDRSYAFPISGAVAGKEVRLEVVGGQEGTMGQDEVGPTLETITERLIAGLEGSDDLVLTTRPEGEAHIVIGVYSRDAAASDTPFTADAGSRIVFLRGGHPTIRTVTQGGATFGEVMVDGDGGEFSLLDEGAWAPGAAPAAEADGAAADDAAADDAAADAAGDGEAAGDVEGDAAAEDMQEAPEEGLDVGIGVGLGEE